MKKNNLDKQLIKNLLNQKININEMLNKLELIDKNKTLKIWKNLYDTSKLKELPKKELELLKFIDSKILTYSGWVWEHEAEYITHEEYTTFHMLDPVNLVSRQLKDTILNELN